MLAAVNRLMGLHTSRPGSNSLSLWNVPPSPCQEITYFIEPSELADFWVASHNAHNAHNVA